MQTPEWLCLQMIAGLYLLTSLQPSHLSDIVLTLHYCLVGPFYCTIDLVPGSEHDMNANVRDESRLILDFMNTMYKGRNWQCSLYCVTWLCVYSNTCFSNTFHLWSLNNLHYPQYYLDIHWIGHTDISHLSEVTHKNWFTYWKTLLGVYQ